MDIYFTFGSVEGFHIENIFSLPPCVHFGKQVSISNFLYVLGVALVAITFSIKKRENFAW